MEGAEEEEGQVHEDEANDDLSQSKTATACQRSNGSATWGIREGKSAEPHEGTGEASSSAESQSGPTAIRKRGPAETRDTPYTLSAHYALKNLTPNFVPLA